MSRVGLLSELVLVHLDPGTICAVDTPNWLDLALDLDHVAAGGLVSEDEVNTFATLVTGGASVHALANAARLHATVTTNVAGQAFRRAEPYQPARSRGAAANLLTAASQSGVLGHATVSDLVRAAVKIERGAERVLESAMSRIIAALPQLVSVDIDAVLSWSRAVSFHDGTLVLLPAPAPLSHRRDGPLETRHAAAVLARDGALDRDLVSVMLVVDALAARYGYELPASAQAELQDAVTQYWHDRVAGLARVRAVVDPVVAVLPFDVATPCSPVAVPRLGPMWAATQVVLDALAATGRLGHLIAADLLMAARSLDLGGHDSTPAYQFAQAVRTTPNVSPGLCFDTDATVVAAEDDLLAAGRHLVAVT